MGNVLILWLFLRWTRLKYFLGFTDSSEYPEVRKISIIYICVRIYIGPRILSTYSVTGILSRYYIYVIVYYLDLIRWPL